jgi:PKD repeat protein
VDRNYFSSLARIARTLMTPRRGILPILVLVSIIGGAVRLAGADTLDPTKPSASFDVSPGSPLSGETVAFTSTSSAGSLGAPISSQAWDLDNDGNFNDATGSEAQRSFSVPGTYTVSLQVTDDAGAFDVATQTVTVANRLPSAGFSISPSSPSTLETVTFDSTSTDADGTIASYAWDLDNDGNFNDGNGSQAQRSFPLAGAYTVGLQVTDNDGGTTSTTRTVDVGNQPPLASFDYTPSTPSTGDDVTLTSSSSDPDGTIASYSWDLDGDNAFGDATAAQAHVTFEIPGNHTVRLRVTDSDGASTTASQVIDVANQAPSASFDFAPSTPKTGDQVTFTSTSSDPDGPIASYAWDLDNDGSFNDGSGSTAQKTFTTQGPHTVQLRVTDSSGTPAIATRTVDVGNRAPTAAFGYAPAAPSTGVEVTLTSSSSDPDGSIASYGWDLDGNGTYGDAAGSETHATFATPGSHTVGLQVTDDSGASDVATVTIAVSNRAPTAAFGFSPSAPQSGELVTFTSTSSDPDGSIASLAWDLDNDGQFDDGTTGTVQTAFATGGAHPVKLRVTDDSGATDLATLSVVVANRSPVASFTSAPAAPKTGEQVTFTSTSNDPDGPIASNAWDLDNDGNFNDGSTASVQRTFAHAGTYTVQLKVTDDKGATAVATTSVTIANRPPTAAFTYLPATPSTGQDVTLNAGASTDPDGSISTFSWDLDGNGTYGDKTGSEAHTTFATPGAHVVRLQVTDNDGASDVKEMTITAANRPPTASIDFSPIAPQTLEEITFSATASDPDGTIAAYAWDLDNDDKFDDGNAAQVLRAFPVTDIYTVKVRVTDSDGASVVATKTVTPTNRPPAASFTTSPATPTTDGPVTFTSTSTDPETQALTTTWDLDDNGTFETSGPGAERQYTIPGAYPFKLKVVDPSGASDIATGTITVANRAPVATVDHEPKNPQTNVPVTFTATASDPENRIKSLSWDLDNDGQFDDATGLTGTRIFKTPAPSSAPYKVRFRIEDLDGSSTIAEHVVAIDNRPPVADFVVFPGSPVAGTPATLVSTAFDPDTPLEKWQWDLDGDGQYDDFDGATTQYTFPAPGTYTVGLKVLDSENVNAFMTKSIVVQAPPVPLLTAPTLTPTGPKLLSPFPVVRLAGRISKRGTRLRLFAIEAPPGARVVVMCRGRSCPFRLSARSAVADRGKGKVHASASLRIRQLEKRVLRKGVTVRIYVTKAGTIGKYVRFKFRKRRPPARLDRCLMPTNPSKPTQCPS